MAHPRAAPGDVLLPMPTSTVGGFTTTCGTLGTGVLGNAGGGGSGTAGVVTAGMGGSVIDGVAGGVTVGVETLGVLTGVRPESDDPVCVDGGGVVVVVAGGLVAGVATTGSALRGAFFAAPGAT